MALKMRLTRKGAKKTPFFRLVVQDGEAPCCGKFLEILGTYDPRKVNNAEKLVFKKDRYDHWYKQGARPSRTVAELVALSIK